MIWTDSFGEGTTLNKQKRADLLLVMVTFFWGASYYLTNLCLTDLQPMNLNAFRFLSAFAVLGVVFRKRLRRISRATLCYTLLVGLALTGTYVAYGYGVSRTSVSNAAFICALPVVVTPIFDFFFCHKKPGRRLLFSLAICTAGLALMTLNDVLAVPLDPPAVREIGVAMRSRKEMPLMVRRFLNEARDMIETL